MSKEEKVKALNEETEKALKDAKNGVNVKTFDSNEEFFKYLNK